MGTRSLFGPITLCFCMLVLILVQWEYFHLIHFQLFLISFCIFFIFFSTFSDNLSFNFIIKYSIKYTRPCNEKPDNKKTKFFTIWSNYHASQRIINRKFNCKRFCGIFIKKNTAKGDRDCSIIVRKSIDLFINSPGSKCAQQLFSLYLQILW